MACIFCRIIEGDVPARIAYQDDEALAFHDVDPQAPVHLLIIPREHIANLAGVTADHGALLGHLLLVARQLAGEHGILDTGFRTVLNTHGDGGQSVDHLHIHVLGGRRLGWPPG